MHQACVPIYVLFRLFLYLPNTCPLSSTRLLNCYLFCTINPSILVKASYFLISAPIIRSSYFHFNNYTTVLRLIICMSLSPTRLFKRAGTGSYIWHTQCWVYWSILELCLIIYSFLMNHHLNNRNYLLNAYCVSGTELNTM